MSGGAAINTRKNTKLLGDEFEEYCKYYLYCATGLKFVGYSEFQYKEYYGLPGKDKGVDLLYVDESDSRLIAVQCKYRADVNRSLSYGGDKISNLLGTRELFNKSGAHKEGYTIELWIVSNVKSVAKDISSVKAFLGVPFKPMSELHPWLDFSSTSGKKNNTKSNFIVENTGDLVINDTKPGLNSQSVPKFTQLTKSSDKSDEADELEKLSEVYIEPNDLPDSLKAKKTGQPLPGADGVRVWVKLESYGNEFIPWLSELRRYISGKQLYVPVWTVFNSTEWERMFYAYSEDLLTGNTELGSLEKTYMDYVTSIYRENDLIDVNVLYKRDPYLWQIYVYYQAGIFSEKSLKTLNRMFQTIPSI